MSQLDYNISAADGATTGSRVVDRDRFHALPQTGTPRAANEETPESDRMRILSQARYHSRNDGLLKENKIVFATYAVGTGLKLQLQGGTPEWQEKAMALWDEWCEMPETSRRFTMPELETFACNALADDGEIFFLLIYDPETKDRPWIQVVESQQVGGGDADITDFGNGVIKDPVTRQPQAYVISDDKGIPRIYPAGAVVHIGLFERPTSDRGTPDFETAVTGTYDRFQLGRLTMTRMQQEANNVQAVEQDATKVDPWGEEEADMQAAFPGESSGGTGTKTAHEELEAILADDRHRRFVADLISKSIGGKTIFLPAGQTIKSLNASTPSGTYIPYIQQSMESDCMGLVPYNILNPEKLSGASMRAALALMASKIELRRQMPIIRGMKRIVQFFLATCIDRGLLEYVDDFDKCDFQTPARITADYGRDAKSDREDLASGVQSYVDNFEARGLDFKTQMRQNIGAIVWLKEECARAGVDPRLVMPLMFQNSNQEISQL